MSDDNNYEEFKQLGSMSIHVYVVFCFIFFLIKDNIFASEDGTSPFIWIIAYVGVFFILLFMLNMSIFSNELVCGEAQPGKAFFNTLYPVTFIFVVVAMLLEAFPGWVRVFSNTFGMSAARMFGIKKLLSDLFNESRKQKVLSQINFNNSSAENAQGKLMFMNTVEMIYNDPVPIINEMDTKRSLRKINENTPNESIVSVWDSWEFLKSKSLFSGLDTKNTMSGGMQPNAQPDFLSGNNDSSSHPPPPQQQQNIVQTEDGDSNVSEIEKLEKQLFEIIKFKENVGYFVWYMMVGLITTVASTNLVLSEGCSVSKSMMDQAYKDFTDSVKNTVV
jgi:hypothetical protein